MVPQTNWLPVSLLTTTNKLELGALLGRGPVRSGAFPPPWLTSNVSSLQMLFVQHLLTTRFAQPENITCPAKVLVLFPRLGGACIWMHVSLGLNWPSDDCHIRCWDDKCRIAMVQLCIAMVLSSLFILVFDDTFLLALSLLKASLHLGRYEVASKYDDADHVRTTMLLMLTATIWRLCPQGHWATAKLRVKKPGEVNCEILSDWPVIGDSSPSQHLAKARGTSSASFRELWDCNPTSLNTWGSNLRPCSWRIEYLYRRTNLHQTRLRWTPLVFSSACGISSSTAGMTCNVSARATQPT